MLICLVHLKKWDTALINTKKYKVSYETIDGDNLKIFTDEKWHKYEIYNWYLSPINRTIETQGAQKIKKIDRNLKIFIPSRGIKVDDKEYKLSDFWNKYNLEIVLSKIYEKTWKKSAVIIDEYDKAVLVNITNISEAEKMRAFFTSFYAGVKDSDDKIEIFMLTWLTKILKMSVFSVLNNLFKNFEFNYYWADTWIPSAILNYIDEKQIDVAVLFANAGYLTIKKAENNQYTLGYPNKETESVMTEFFYKIIKAKF